MFIFVFLSRKDMFSTQRTAGIFLQPRSETSQMIFMMTMYSKNSTFLINRTVTYTALLTFLKHFLRNHLYD